MDTTARSLDELPLILTPIQAAELLQIGRTRMYELCHVPGFPATRVGKGFRIHKDKLMEWILNGGLDQVAPMVPPRRPR